MLDRETGWGLAGQQVFDVMIMGGGINGTCLFDRLTRQGYAVLLVDRKDFGSGTTQASGMMVWGGLLYLRNLDLLTIFRLSRDRDAMIGELTAHISPRMYRYIPSAGGNLSPGLVRAALYVYWAMGFFRRKSPRSEKSFHESCLLRPGVHRGSLLYEEAVLNTSDCRFAFEWLASARWAGSAALNYCTARGEYSPADRLWHLTLKDTLKGKTASVRARLVVNCGGVWTDEVNESFGIETPFRHALSKGVYIGLNRPPEHDSLMIFEMGDHRDVVTFVPWGPVSLWGPTETFPRDIEAGMSLEAEDVRFLLGLLEGHLKPGFDKSQIVSVRCGIRPLAVRKGFTGARYPLDLSRRQYVVADEGRPWISSYGGKITGCREMAGRISRAVGHRIGPASGKAQENVGGPSRNVEWRSWPGLEERVPSPSWCARRELCCTLEDYLRRRTNISQWVPRQGLGKANEYRESLVNAAMEITGGTRSAAETMVKDYEMDVEERFDKVLDRV